MQAKARGFPVLSIGSLLDEPFTGVVYLKDSGITTDFRTLKGRRIGYVSHQRAHCVDSKALEHLKSLYKMQDSRALQITYNNMDNLYLSKCTSITDYLNKIRQLRNDVKELGDAFTDSQHINKIIKGLTKPYDGWIERYHNGYKEENCFLKDLSKKDDKQGSSNKAAEAKTHTSGASSSSNSKPKGYSAAVEINIDAFKKAIIEGKANAAASIEEAICALDIRIETITLPAMPIDLNPNRFYLLLSNVADEDAEDKDDDKHADDEPADDNDKDAIAKDRNRSSSGWVIK
ncbi:Glycylpeptide N-tetradecanoyltransferase [Elasticomyces elasticus]|nr:Glycylpeptide N-tetradecanoyltransferase [Elasticomyces elasticus]